MLTGRTPMAPQSAFPDDVLTSIARADEVQIEPATLRPVTIWIVVADGRVYVRSYRGPDGRWYRQLASDPHATLHVDGRGLPVRATQVTDPATIDRVSRAFRDKYEQRWPSETAAMLIERVLPTTLVLSPAA